MRRDTGRLAGCLADRWTLSPLAKEHRQKEAKLAARHRDLVTGVGDPVLLHAEPLVSWPLSCEIERTSVGVIVS